MINILWVVIRKMINNKWMVLCLLVGTILSTAMVSSIPMYTNGILQRILTKDLEQFQIERARIPGSYHVQQKLAIYAEEDRTRAYHLFDNQIKETMIPQYDIPIITQVFSVTIDYLQGIPEIQREAKPVKRSFKLQAFSDIGEHIQILQGHMFADEPVDGIYEVIVTEGAMEKMNLLLNEVISVTDIRGLLKEPLRFKIVGIYGPKEEQDPYWYESFRIFESSVFMDPHLFEKTFIHSQSPLVSEAQWYYAFDLYGFQIDLIDSILDAYEKDTGFLKNYSQASLTMRSIPILEEYQIRARQLKITLWVLQIPLLVMLVFFTFMVSQMILDHEKNEIAVFKSRGASGGQIFWLFVIQSIIIGCMGLLVGPPLALYICRILGASNGFLEWVQRTSLPLRLDFISYKYALGMVLLSVLNMLIPPILYARTTIVQHKQSKARKKKTAFWMRYGIDIMICLISLYGLYSFHSQNKLIQLSQAETADIPLDPLLFLSATLFMIGFGLFSLRIFPYMVRCIYWIGRKRWSPVLYASLIKVGRSSGEEQFIMLFLILTVSIGIFDAKAARTINQNMEDRIRYEVGADITLQEVWNSNQVQDEIDMSMMPQDQSVSFASKEPIQYTEPDFQTYRELSAVEMATKVFRRQNAICRVGDRSASVYLMGIISDEFGKTAWFREDLLPLHWYEYLNVLAKDPKALLVSRSFEEKYNVKLGDSLYMKWGEQNYIDGVVYAIIDFWPTYSPYGFSGTDGGKTQDLIVANLSYLQTKSRVEPYEVWIRTSEGSVNTLIQAMESQGRKLSSFVHAESLIVSQKNDPILQGTNGVLTVGFIVTLFISSIGFLIYWILSIHKRVLQFGIFRAMGLSVYKVLGMLLMEQILISGTAIAIGIGIGEMTSVLFMPMLRLGTQAAEQIVPFHIFAEAGDYQKLFGVIFIVLLFCIVVLGSLISKIKIVQALKLGED